MQSGARGLALVTLLVRGYDEAIEWFTERLGFELVEDAPRGPAKRWVVVAPRGGCGSALLLARADGAAQRARIGDQTGGRVGFFLYTDDFRRDHAAMRAAGVRFAELPRDEPYGSVAVFEDLYGNRWDLLERRPAPAGLGLAGPLVIASGNPGKLAEFASMLAGSGLEAVPQSAFGVNDAEETASTFVENALLKARHAARLTGRPALADDSGLCVDALGGAPGLYSARYAGMHGDAAANIAKLLEALRDVPDTARTAHFHAAIVLLRHADDPQPLIAEGRWRGRILHAPRGAHGFGYDPVFFDPVHGCSAAELDPAIKHRISHRGLALASLRAQLGPVAG